MKSQTLKLSRARTIVTNTVKNTNLKPKEQTFCILHK